MEHPLGIRKRKNNDDGASHEDSGSVFRQTTYLLFELFAELFYQLI